MAEFRLYRFKSNNLKLCILATVLFVEQLLLGIFIAEPSSTLQSIYLGTSAFMALFAVFGLKFLGKNSLKINGWHELFQFSFPFFGMAVALGRFLTVDNMVFTIPTVYIAVLYGAAVIFLFDSWQCIFFYSAVTVSAIVLLPQFHPEIIMSNYRADIITNGIIALTVMLMTRTRYISSFIDKKHIEIINQELREQTIRDGLTGLYNRRKLDEVFGEVCMKAARYENDFSVIMIDLDHFKSVNDNYGHHVGDTVLVEFSRILENNIRDVDVCGRWGGEEFLIICQETVLESAIGFADRLRQSIEAHSFSNSSLSITASFGVASWSCCSDEFELLNEVDSRLYDAKAAGRNIVCASTGCFRNRFTQSTDEAQ
ncbi:MAG: GGDEF domain-containing protein [Spirochaetales bacterium]|uniref:diguanylate cyclase n=1 Tax=Candidatus Thalassospirochaeta sargassi TaxID=3119039 RepID=A0AAJ1IGK1_9SPIO|nr:GGDEF domain-containing protein [Spirochaetales bacterium]